MSPAVAIQATGVDCLPPSSGPLSVAAVDAEREIVRRLAIVAQYRDDETGAHAAHVAAISLAVAHELGLSSRTASAIELAAPLHDLGKVAIPDSILLKRGPLTDLQRRVMERHTTIGAQMLADSVLPVLQVARVIALSHHERWDGTGYPSGLSGSQIPLAGRIVAIADVFDALTSPRPYKPAWSLDQALSEIRSQRGSHFEPAVTDAFLRLDHRALSRAA